MAIFVLSNFHRVSVLEDECGRGKGKVEYDLNEQRHLRILFIYSQGSGKTCTLASIYTWYTK